MLKLIIPFLPLFAFSEASAMNVLITGANRGIGLEFARHYKERGYTVIGTARNLDQATELKALGVRVELLDVADASSIAALKQRLANVPLDIVINNAGVLEGKNATLETLNFDDFAKSFAINSTAPIRVTQALLPNLRAGKQKKIINITSQLGSIQDNSGGYYPYRASKAALNQLTKTMSLELEKENFICIVMHPGWVKTDMGGPMAPITPKQAVQAMLTIIDGLDKSSNGRYLDLHGNSIPW